MPEQDVLVKPTPPVGEPTVDPVNENLPGTVVDTQKAMTEQHSLIGKIKDDLIKAQARLDRLISHSRQLPKDPVPPRGSYAPGDAPVMGMPGRPQAPVQGFHGVPLAPGVPPPVPPVTPEWGLY
jgi:hypothetical protein